MKKHIFLDTNNWIYLSNGLNILSNKYDELHFKIFDFVKKHTDNENLIFLVNEIVLEEWERNKQSTGNQIKELRNKLKSYQSQLKTIKQLMNGKSDSEINALNELMTKEIEERIVKHEAHIIEVDDYLKTQTEMIEVRDEIKVQASELALSKKAPFVGDKRNSMADAVILLSSIDHIKKNLGNETDLSVFGDKYEVTTSYPESYFVSSNKGDFCDPTDPETIHKDLQPFLESTKTQFYFTLGKLVIHIEAEYLTKEEEETLADFHRLCEMCDHPYPSLDISEPFLVDDENKRENDANQLELIITEADEKPIIDTTEIRVADCSHCASKYVLCPCGELTYMDDYNEVVGCSGNCGNYFLANGDYDTSGYLHDVEYEIKKAPNICQRCGNDDAVISKETGICEKCENSYSYGD